MDIKKYDNAISYDIAATKAMFEIWKDKDTARMTYLRACATQINSFLKSNGRTLVYNPETDSDYHEFITNHFELGSKEQDAIIKFVSTLPSFEESGVEILPSTTMTSYAVFYEEDIPFNLVRSDFSSEDNFRMYKQHVYAATHDFD